MTTKQFQTDLRLIGQCILVALQILVEGRRSRHQGSLKCRKRFSGKLTYAANWDCFHEPSFWGSLDAVGVNAYFPIRNPYFKAAWSGYHGKLRAIHARTGKPVLFTEYGYRSIENTQFKPWDQPGDRRPSPQAQEEALASLYESFWQNPPHWFAGGFLWKWKLRPLRERDARGYTVQGKPALELVRHAYSTKQP